ncbi:MAG: hypothetical protein K2Q18_04255 [Bdellovibrionales bacterium]|nr:hypothetical protein [Bdellovibrionales bacterium]
MKALFVFAASLLFSQSAERDSKTSELTDSFSDLIHTISEENKDLIVTFQRHFSNYVIPCGHPQFAEIKIKLEKAQKIDQKIKVVAIIPSMTIKEIRA